MLFMLVGIVLMVAKYMEVDPVATWSWWVVLSPFALAVAWWAYADASGLTKKRANQKQEARKQARLDQQREKLGINPRKK
jgi:small Trp-rich protein